MRKIVIFLAVAFAGLFFSSCKKTLSDPHDYYPKLKTVSATVQPDGSVTVKGEVISEGEAPIEYAGFCVDTVPVPGMAEGQAIVDVIGNTFEANYSGFDIHTTYYFRTWATNKYGYSYGDVIFLDDIEAAPVVAPCTLVMNTVNIGGFSPTTTIYMASMPQLVTTEWELSAQSGSTVMYFRFHSRPRTGIYITTTSTTPGDGYVNMIFYSGSSSGALSDGSNVYINQTGTDSWEMTICSAPWSLAEFNTRFRFPL